MQQTRKHITAIGFAMPVLVLALGAASIARVDQTRRMDAMNEAHEVSVVRVSDNTDSDEQIRSAREALASLVRESEWLVSRIDASGVRDSHAARAFHKTFDHAGLALRAQRITSAASFDIERDALTRAYETAHNEYDAHVAAQALSQTQAQTQARTGDTWYASYYSAIGATQADPNGALTQWKPGFYLAHNWSEAGHRIASCTPRVIIDGRAYVYASSKLVTPGTTWGEIRDFVHEGGGIGFQTCYGSGYLITHYVPE